MDRRAVRQAFKETRPDAGIYAVHIGARTWVGAAARLSAAENRLRFMLSLGHARNPALEAAFRQAGAFRFEVLESLDDDLSAMARERLLKERLAHWLADTGGTPV